MSHDAISSWVENAKNGSRSPSDAPRQGVQVVRATPQPNKGNIILELADKLLPSISRMLTGVRDDNGLLLQPAHIRAITLDVAQRLVKQHQA